jgi:hypothetical protein
MDLNTKVLSVALHVDEPRVFPASLSLSTRRLVGHESLGYSPDADLDTSLDTATSNSDRIDNSGRLGEQRQDSYIECRSRWLFATGPKEFLRSFGTSPNSASETLPAGRPLLVGYEMVGLAEENL